MFLRTAPHLREMKSEECTPKGIESCEETATFPSTEVLRIRWHFLSDLDYLQFLTFPNLRKLIISAWFHRNVLERWWKIILHGGSYHFLTEVVLEVDSSVDVPNYPPYLGELIIRNPSIQALTFKMKKSSNTMGVLAAVCDICDAIRADKERTIKLRQLTIPENVELEGSTAEILKDRGVTLRYDPW